MVKEESEEKTNEVAVEQYYPCRIANDSIDETIDFS